MATSVGGTLTGRGGNIFVLDDVLAVDQQDHANGVIVDLIALARRVPALDDPVAASPLGWLLKPARPKGPRRTYRNSKSPLCLEKTAATIARTNVLGRVAGYKITKLDQLMP